MSNTVELGNMLVRYKADLSNLTSGMSGAKTSMSEADSVAQSTGSNISSAFSKAGSAVAEFGSKTVSGVDVAQAKIVLMESKVAEAKNALQELQGAADAGKAVTGIEEAQANLTILQSRAQDARESLAQLGTQEAEVAEESSGGFSSGIASMGSGLMGLFNNVTMTAMNFQMMGQMAVQAGQSLLGPASAAENTQASFSNLLGSTQAATNELGQLNDLAAKTQFKTQDIDNMAASMIAFKTPTQAIIPELTSVGDALTAVGKGTPAEMQSVVDILGKMGIQGKLTQGDITQLGTHGINALDLIAEGSGLSTKAIQDMTSKGTLSATDAISDLTKGIEGNPVYSGGMAKQSNTLSGQMSTLASNWDQAMAAFGSPVLTSVESNLGGLENTIASPSFKQFASVVGTDIVKAIGNAAQFFSAPAFKQFADLVGGQLATGVKNLAGYLTSPAFAQFAKVAGQDIAGALLIATKDIEGIVSWTIQWHEPILIVAGVLAALFIPALIQSGVESTIAGGKIAVEFVGNIIKTGVEGWAAAGKVLEFVGSIIASGMEAGIAGVKIAVNFVGGLIASGVQAGIAGAKIGLEFTAGLIKAGAQAGLTAIKFTAELIPAIISFAAESVVSAATAIPAMITGFIAWGVAAWGAAAGVIAATWPLIAIGVAVVAVVAIIVLAVTHWGDIVKWLQGAWSVVASFFTGLFTGIWDFLKKWGVDILLILMGPVGLIIMFWKPISGFFVGLWQDIQNIFHTALNWIINNAVTLGRILFVVLTGPVGLLVLYVIDHWNQIMSFLAGIPQNIQSALSSLGSIFMNIGTAMWSGVKWGINAVIGDINQFIGFIDGIQLHIPSVGVGPVSTPAFDWNGVGLSKIPLLASGGTVGPGQEFFAGEKGIELVRGGSSGASVSSNSTTMAMIMSAVLAALAQQQQQPVIVHIHNDTPDLYVDGERMTDALGPHMANALRLEGGLRRV